ncbi:cyclin-C isoform X2 [Syngnathus acus]|uniref:cyclin-C isoform X2 n=1 Tax=Syngnathus acus TaxID=161584 RepID=UPI0018862CB3|nr:cyclin-C isoform X2 [Syngnathus acus]
MAGNFWQSSHYHSGFGRTLETEATGYRHCYCLLQTFLCKIFPKKYRPSSHGSYLCFLSFQGGVKTRFSYAFPKEFPYRMNHILECEFYLLELMDCCLIVYHPYRPLLQYVQDMGQEDMLLPLAWRIVNDTYRTDLCLLYPPFMIALACLHVACVVQQKDARQWFAELSVDMDKILEIIRVILKLYDQWKNFDDRKEIAAVLNKMPKPKPPPNSENDQSSNGNQSNSYNQS